LPLNPAEQVAASGIELPPELLSLLIKLARSLDDTLGTRLDRVYPMNAMAASQTQESES
jgi:membrane protein